MKTMKENKLTFENHGSKEVDPIHRFYLKEEKLRNTPAHNTHEFWMALYLYLFHFHLLSTVHTTQPLLDGWGRTPVTKASWNLLSRFDAE